MIHPATFKRKRVQSPLHNYKCIATYSRNYWLLTYSPRFWVKNVSGSPGNWNDTANWSATSGGAGGSSVPGASDDVTFDGNGISGCVFDVAVSVASITATSAYTGGGANDGHLDNATNDQTVAVSDDVILDNNEVSMGDATWTVGGNWDHQMTSTFSSDLSTLVLTGSNKTLTGKSTHLWNNVTVNSGASYTVNTNSQAGKDLLVDGTLSVDSGRTIRIMGDVTIGVLGSIPGAGILNMNGTNVTLDNGGSLTVANLTAQLQGTSIVIGAGVFGSTTLSLFQPGPSDTIQFGSDLEFTTAVKFENTSGGQNGTIDNSGNHNLIFKGDFTLAENNGLVWIKGTGTITLSGTALQTITTLGKDLDDIVNTNKSAGGVTFKEVKTALLTVNADTANVLMKFNETAAHFVDQFALSGTAAFRVQLRSEVDANQWDVTTVGDQGVDHVDVKDSNMGGGTYTVSSGTDSGNNSANWVFVMAGTGGLVNPEARLSSLVNAGLAR